MYIFVLISRRYEVMPRSLEGIDNQGFQRYMVLDNSAKTLKNKSKTFTKIKDQSDTNLDVAPPPLNPPMPSNTRSSLDP
jgi:hypothetical protein